VGTSARGIRDEASEGSGPSGFLGDPPHVNGGAHASTTVRGTASDGGGNGGEFPFPRPVATATRGRERDSLGVPGLPRGREQSVQSHHQGPYAGQAWRDRPVGPLHTPPEGSGVEAPQGSVEGDPFSAALRD